MMDMEFLVTSRVADDASTPAYHAPTTVCRRPKARMAMAMPRTVNEVRSLCRKAFLMTSLNVCIQHTLIQFPDDMGLLRCTRIMRNHDDCLAEFVYKPFHEV